MAAAGEEDMFESSDSSLDTTQEEEGEGEVEAPGSYRIVTGKRLNCSKLWLAGDYLYNFERPNKTIMTPGGLQPAVHLRCRKYSTGCGGRAVVNEMNKLVIKPGHPHTCTGGGREEAEVLEVGVSMRKAQLENPREEPRKIFNTFHGPAAQQHAFDSVRRQMTRLKNKMVPPPPKTAEEAATVVNQSQYSGYLHAELRVDGEVGLIWYHPELNSILEEHGPEQEVSCDGTFKFVPHLFGNQNKQHWTIFLLVGENFLPAVQEIKNCQKYLFYVFRAHIVYLKY